jgi:uncharacterized protein YecT (DUF1311 family)
MAPGYLFGVVPTHRVPSAEEVSKRIQMCIASGATKQQTICLASLFTELDSDLNAEYARVSGIISVKQLPLLVNAEKQWVLFRDAHCIFDASGEMGGTLEKLEELSCRAEITGERARYLESRH